MKRFFSIFTFLCLFGLSSVFSQSNVNSYKYVIVPEQYEFQKSEDQYQINSLTKFLFRKYGFTVLSSSESYPPDLALNPCLGLKGLVKNTSGMLTVKVKVELVDCYNNSVFSTSEGKSKSKDYKKGYHEAIRSAFADIDSLNYKYNGTSVVDKRKSPVVVKTDPTIPVAAAKETPVVVAPVEVVQAENKKEQVKTKVESKKYTIEGSYLIDMWGTCIISKKGDGYKVVGGDNFEFATISKTSAPNLFMVKKTGFKDPQLLELDINGNLKIDSKDGFKVYKRVN